MRWLAILLLLATPVTAQVPDRQTLEAPDRIWLRETLHPAAELGITVPFFPYVEFQDGRFHDRMATFSYVIAPDSCPDPFRCADAVNDAAMFDGSYALTDTGLALSDINESPLIFDRANVMAALRSDSFSRGETNVILKMDNGALQRTTPGGAVRYVPAQTDDVADILGLAFSFEVSIAQNYDCMVSGHLARRAMAQPDALSRALLALARLGAHQMDVRDQQRALTHGDTVEAFDLPQAEQDALQQISFQQIALQITTLDMRDAYSVARNTNDLAPLPPLPSIADTVPASILDHFPPDDLPAIMDDLQAQLDLARLALPASYHVENISPSRSQPSDLLCHAG